MEEYKKWKKMSFKERRMNVSAYLVNLHTMECNPCGLFEINTLLLIDNNVYKIIKLTRNESRDITFYYCEFVEVNDANKYHINEYNDKK
jgi:hypothetical protein